MRLPAERSPPPPRPSHTALKTTLRLAVVAYWVLGVGLGFTRLRLEDFSQEAWGSTLTIWYAEALIFLAVFGGGAVVAGVLTRAGPRARRRSVSDPLKTSALAGLERIRGH